MPNTLAALQLIKEVMDAEMLLAEEYEFALIEGHIGREPETRFTSSGKAVAKAPVAVSWGKRGEDQQTVWWELQAWEDRAEQLSQFSKGDAISVWGKVEVRAWTGNDGVERKTNQLTVWGMGRPIYKKQEQPAQKSQSAKSAASTAPDEIPF